MIAEPNHHTLNFGNSWFFLILLCSRHRDSATFQTLVLIRATKKRLLRHLYFFDCRAANNKIPLDPLKNVGASECSLGFIIVKTIWNGLPWVNLLVLKFWLSKIFPTEILYLIQIVVIHILHIKLSRSLIC